MKISLNWIKKYVNVPISDEDLIRLIGARLVEVEGVIDETEKYNNIYVAKVATAEKIPDTHLTLCQIDVGKMGMQQVVCGAPNVREGMLAAWIAPGAIVPASVHEDAPFVIGKRKMLNKYDSDGMLAGADELDFGDDHSGIVEIDPSMAKPGDLLKDIFNLEDKILEIENKSLTHRPDCFGIIGFSREVAGILGQPFNEPGFLFHEEVFPEGFLKKANDGVFGGECNLEVEITDANLCPRYTCAMIKVNEATEKYQYLSEMAIMLAKSGMSSISKIVDVTNYLMLLSGQPLHAFDYDKFLAVGGTANPRIIVRKAMPKEKLELLDGSAIECVDSDIVITSNNVPVALAGAMGGKNTEIDENTKNVLLESASFSLYNLRKTQMAHGIFSEAITRFTKGVPVGGTFMVLAEAIKEINGKPLAVCDKFLGWHGAITVAVTADEINGLLGTNYSEELITKTLTNVGFDVKPGFSITAPIWRTDIHIKEDIIEEVGRLLGYDNIAPVLPLHGTAARNKALDLKTKIRDILSSFGANEVLTYSFVSSKLLEKVGLDVKNSYKIVNSISPELQLVRQSIIPSLLDKAYVNQKLPVDKFAIFEINKVYQKTWGVDNEKVPVEKSRLGFVLAERKTQGIAYYKAKYYVEKLLEALNIEAEIKPLKSTTAEAKPFEKKRAAEIVVNGETIGVIGEFRSSVKHNFKLNDFLAGFELDFDKLVELSKLISEVDVAPVVDKRDLTIETNKTYGEIIAKIQEILAKHSLEAKISPLAIYQPEEIKHISVHLEFKQKIDDSLMSDLEKIN